MRPFEDFERFFDQLVPRGWRSPLRWERTMMPELSALEVRMPKLDVIDRDDEFVVKAEIPGVKKEDIHVSLTGNLMTVKGETTHEAKDESASCFSSVP